jgi:hypothetical protein
MRKYIPDHASPALMGGSLMQCIRRRDQLRVWGDGEAWGKLQGVLREALASGGACSTLVFEAA